MRKTDGMPAVVSKAQVTGRPCEPSDLSDDDIDSLFQTLAPYSVGAFAFKDRQISSTFTHVETGARRHRAGSSRPLGVGAR